MNEPKTLRNLGWRPALAAALLALAAAPADARAVKSGSAVVRAMTFNIRFDFDSDGPNRWRFRVDSIAKQILESKAVVVCLQEDKEHQIADLKTRLEAHYGFHGKGRNPGGSGERCSILYLKKRFTQVQAGDFWLSDTPDVAGSNTWGDKYPRKVSWMLLECKQTRKRLLVLNTHLPEGNAGHLRRKGMEVMARWIQSRLGEGRKGKKGERMAVLVTGDFNTEAGSEDQQILLKGAGLPLRDAWVEAKPVDPSPGTYNGFRGMKTRDRIDWLLVGGAARVLAAKKLDAKVDGRWTSDHYPVLADLALN